MKIVSFAVLVFICSTAFYLNSSAQQSQTQIRSCRRITACRTETGTNNQGMSMCSVKYSLEGCDGTIPGGGAACVNRGCEVQDCSCSCTGSAPDFNSYGISYTDCDDVTHITTKVCDRCANPTPTPTPTPCPTPTGPPPGGRRDCLWFKSTCSWGCGQIAVTEEQCEAEGWTFDLASNTCQTPTPTPTPTPLPTGGGGGGGGGWQPPACDPGGGTVYTIDGVEVGGDGCYSPVLIDTTGDGFALTDTAGGVSFDLDGDGTGERLSWTAAGSDNAWLALDRDGNGRVDSGRELFGNFTPQPPAASPNGFLALAEYDRAGRGGNGDGVIDAGDSIFAFLRLWRDANHNGVSEAGELLTLSERGVESFSLDYRESRMRDRHGNWFRYRARVHGNGRTGGGRWAYDVFLLSVR